MKFRAFFTLHGVNLLEKRFVPAFDKIGRICHLYLTRDYVIFLHNLLNGDGVQAIAQFRKEVLFQEYRISSQNDDRIAFTIDLALLHRALRSSVSIEAADKLQIKLVKKLALNSQLPMPYLTFESKGYKSAVIQDVPVSKPLSRADVQELQSALDMAQDLPQTLVQVPDLLHLQNYVERLKHVGDLLNVSITQYGDLHVQVSTTLITVGTEFRKLRVLGVQGFFLNPRFQYEEGFLYSDNIRSGVTKVIERLAPNVTFAIEATREIAQFRGKIGRFGDLTAQTAVGIMNPVNQPAGDGGLSAPARTEMAIQRGEALSVQVSMKHFAKSLQCQLTKPDSAFYGIAPQGACLTVIFQFFVPGTRQVDKSISLHCRLPVLDTGSG